MSATAAPEMTAAEAVEYACAAHPGVWSERKLGFKNEPFHWEWYELGLRERRLCVVAPREHAKTEVFSVNSTAHHVVYSPGMWQYVFSATMDQAKMILERIASTVAQVAPELVDNAIRFATQEVIFANSARVTVSSVGKAVRGVHPDRIVGDDILEESTTLTSYQRKRMERWWFGTVGPMAHPGVTRPLRWTAGGGGQKLWHPPTKITLVGTPFHQLDLLMAMRENPLYRFRRYAAEFDPGDRVPGMMAVEAA